jgi:hypothetical protein
MTTPINAGATPASPRDASAAGRDAGCSLDATAGPVVTGLLLMMALLKIQLVLAIFVALRTAWNVTDSPHTQTFADATHSLRSFHMRNPFLDVSAAKCRRPSRKNSTRSILNHIGSRQRILSARRNQAGRQRLSFYLGVMASSEAVLARDGSVLGNNKNGRK